MKKIRRRFFIENYFEFYLLSSSDGMLLIKTKKQITNKMSKNILEKLFSVVSLTNIS